MDFFQRQSSKRRLTHEQVRVLEWSFTISRKLEPARKLQLAEQLGIPARQVAVWYQNKRARWRAQSLELDCGTMQLRLDEALAEKRRLETELGWLRAELEKAKELLFDVERKKLERAEFSVSVSSRCEVEGSAGSSSFCDNKDGDLIVVDDNGDDGDRVLQFDHELFASFIHGSDDDDHQTIFNL